MKTQLTIADYINNYRTDIKPQANSQTFKNSRQPTESFINILSGLNKEDPVSGETKTFSAKNKGLTLDDYLKNPIRTSFASKNKMDNAAAVNNAKQQEKISGLSQGQPLNTIKNSSEQISKSRDIRQKIDACIAQASQKYDIQEELIQGIVRAESGFQPHVISPAGAQGLMQLMPDTAKELGVTDPFDIKENIDGGVRYFKKMMDQFDGNINLSLAAYNAGPGTVRRYNGIPPYNETRQYVEKVIKFSQVRA